MRWLVVILLLATSAYAYEGIDLWRMAAAARQHNEIVFSGPAGDTNFVAWYKYSDSNAVVSGYYEDYSGWGNHSTQATAGARATWATNAIRLDGTADFHYDETPILILSNFSLSAWVTMTAHSGNDMIVQKGVYTPSEQTDAGMQVNPSSQVQIFYNGPTFPDSGIETVTALTNNSRTHVVGTFDATTLVATIYFNGIALTSRACTLQNSYQSTNGITVGALRYQPTYPSMVSFFDGVLDDVRVYSRTLTSNEVMTMFNAGPQ